VAASLRDDYGVTGEKLRVIPFGITVGDPPIRRPDHSRPEITFVGTSLERKGGHRLLRVFRRGLRGRCTLNLVTRERLLPEPGVRVYDDLVTGDPRLAEILARTSVFAFPSEIDCSPYSVLEAMHAGLPVVAVRRGGVPEMVVDGETGLLVEPDDDALLAALEQLLADRERAEEMGRAGRRRLEDRFDARRTTADLVALLHEIDPRS
jgi:glycosyltransferase involved in cell wall biosynthesis